MAGTSLRTIEFLRIANPWMVGKHVDRIVPLYALQNFAAPDFDRDPNMQAIKHLAIDAQKGLDAGLKQRVSATPADLEDLRCTARGLFSPEDRIFLDRASGGAGKQGAPFPVVAGLLTLGASDEGLGRRVRELLDRYPTNWNNRLVALLAPAQPHDPATSFTMTLLGGTAGQAKGNSNAGGAEPLTGLDLACAGFVDHLIPSVDDARRVPELRKLACGLYLAAVIRMVAGPGWELNGKVSPVMVFAGMPPGQPGDPLVRAACNSFQSWIASSWRATAELLSSRIDNAPSLENSTGKEKRSQQVHFLLQERMSHRQNQLQSVMEAMQKLLQSNTTGVAWCQEAMETEEVNLSRQELARRVRSLGGNIGLTGPDRGTGSPRLVFDTPLLGVLVKGLVGDGSIEFKAFVSKIAQSFGLVVGLGEDDAVPQEIELIGSDGYDAYEILERNQELFRERLLRAGLARSYSDSHTEVFCNV